MSTIDVNAVADGAQAARPPARSGSPMLGMLVTLRSLGAR